MKVKLLYNFNHQQANLFRDIMQELYEWNHHQKYFIVSQQYF